MAGKGHWGKRMVWTKSQRWESSRCGGSGGSEEAHLAGLGVLPWGKVGIEAEKVRMRVLCLPGYGDAPTPVPPHRAPSATARESWYPTLNIFLKCRHFLSGGTVFRLSEDLDRSYSANTNKNEGFPGQHVSHFFPGRKFNNGFNFQRWWITEWTNQCDFHTGFFPEFSMLPRRGALGNRGVFGLW